MLPDSEQEKVKEYVEFLLSKKGQKHKNLNMPPKAGFMKGTFQMSKDFDAPLEDFNDYMH